MRQNMLSWGMDFGWNIWQFLGLPFCKHHILHNKCCYWNHKWATKTLTSTFRTQNFITFLAWYFPGYCINRPALCMKVFDFCLSWSLASVKSMWFKTFMSECGLKDWKISLILKWKIRSVMEWKCSENINSPSGDQYRIFTHILQK